MKKITLALVFLFCFCLPSVWAQQPAPSSKVELMGAVIKEQEVTFAVVLVKKSVLNDKIAADSLIGSLEAPFGGIPVVLMAQDDKGTPSYYGREDIAQFMATVPIENIPWKKYALNYKQR